MIDELVCEASPLWDRAPSVALVLFASVPGGIQAVVNARASVRSVMFTPEVIPRGPFVMLSLRHVVGDFHAFPSPLLYLGFGHSDIQGRPSQWANPFYFFVGNAKNSFALYLRYLESRGDLLEYLTPLSNAELICDCNWGQLVPWARLNQDFP